MKHYGNRVEDLKIAYIGGGSRGWAWGLMSDLAAADDISGDVYLYDIDMKAAEDNVIIGNKFNDLAEAKSKWNYKAVDNIKDALVGADFVVISILPGTFDEMESDVHTPEKYGIYQSVGDTSGPGGIVRALRTLPMYEGFALAIKEYCPKAWVINYTNPMTLCVAQLYKTFPEIKAFGCCHEVFGTMAVLMKMLREEYGKEDVKRADVKVNVVGVNHFTWLTKAQYKNMDLFPAYKKYCEKYKDIGTKDKSDTNWMNNFFDCNDKVKMDLFLKTGVIAAAGDRHLAEFCPGKWYLESTERVKEMGFGLTPVSWRKNDLKDRLKRSADRISGAEEIKIRGTGEEGVLQIRALLGLHSFVTNVNIPNVGQIPNLPLGAVVETNAYFCADNVTPVMAGNVPEPVNQLVAKICNEQETVLKAINDRDLDLALLAFCADPLVTCTPNEAKELFKEMLLNTKEYLTMYDVEGFIKGN